MGVPAFFRWLTKKYPSVIVNSIEQKTVDVNGVQIPIDTSDPNPNGVEFDNLYLDMNGIIHPCTHPEDKPAPKNEDEMMIAIFECIDRLFRIVRPRKLLYMAIDGVAPRAKMNQQRSRRFRASKETYEKVTEISRVRAELLLKGCLLPPEKPKEEHFDSNCITPGTPFMARLSACLHYYIHERLNNDPGWKGIKVILSDANVPGEGEHKIMDYIRKQRAQPDHDPNTQHCLCGADADLIMLGLATHEPNFTIIREELKPMKGKPCEVCGQIGHDLTQCVGLAAENTEDAPPVFGAEVDFIFVRLCVLREYLERELAMPNLPFKYDFERALDDWVFMCFFVGNDFLPHLPSLEIRENAIDRLIKLYKDAVYETGGWLTDSGDVNLERVQLILTSLGKVEDEIFKRRQYFEEQNEARKKMRSYQQNRPDWSLIKNTQFEPTAIGKQKTILNPRQEAFQIRKAGMHTDSNQSSTSSSAAPATPSESDSNSGQERRGVKRTHDEMENEDKPHDEVRLWEDGFKDRYYESKFDVPPENLEFRYNVALHYVRGLCWVLRYYYQGCASWKWYYPYHYAPFASDFVNIAGLSTEFETGTKPFNPLEQLMGVFPAASSKHVPKPWAKLMSDPESPIIDFYPQDFQIDLNGKKYAWQGVALLPFVDEKRLFKALKPYYQQLTAAEKVRNITGDSRLYVKSTNASCSYLKGLYDEDLDSNMEVDVVLEGMKGTILVASECVGEEGYLNSPIPDLPAITDNMVYCARYRDPAYPQGFIFPAARLPGAKMPDRVLKPGDLSPQANRNWRPQIGMTRSTQRASLTDAGHRMVNHYAPKNPQNSYNSNNSGGRNFYNRGRGGHGSDYHNQRPNYGSRGGGGGGGGGSGGGGGGGYQQQRYNYNTSGRSHYQNDRSNDRYDRNNDRFDNRNNDRYDRNYGNNSRGGAGSGPYRDRYVPHNPNSNRRGGNNRYNIP